MVRCRKGKGAEVEIETGKLGQIERVVVWMVVVVMEKGKWGGNERVFVWMVAKMETGKWG